MSNIKLVLLPFLQHWDGGEASLTVRLLLIPRGNPLQPLVVGSSGPNFPNANFQLDVFLLSGVADLPKPDLPALTQRIVLPRQPLSVDIFNALAAQFPIDPNPTPPKNNPKLSTIKKHLPVSYQTSSGYTSGRTPNVYTDNTYSCMLKRPPPPFKAMPPPPPLIPWGKVIAILMKNVPLAEATGLIQSFKVPIPDPKMVKNGGYIFLKLAPTSDAYELVTTNAIDFFAARIPRLKVDESRNIFNPILFPVKPTSPPGDYALISAEATDYDDGFAKTVHSTQPKFIHPRNDVKPDGTRPAKELGIRIGWDDEQVTVWLNRQLGGIDLQCPLGTAGYRVDVRLENTTHWSSLCHATGVPALKDVPGLPNFDGEMSVEVYPVQQDAQVQGDYWLPTYFTSWTGPALVGPDLNRILLAGELEPDPKPTFVGTLPDVTLRYGKTYEFRVRLRDQTGGGPTPDDDPRNPGLSPISKIPFRRYIQPLQPKIVVADDASEIVVSRPLLHYPAVVCADYPDAINLLLQDIPVASTEKREPGLPDPDVEAIQITVEVAGLIQDPATTDGNYMPVYTTTRKFADNPTEDLTLALNWVDIKDVTQMVAAGVAATEGPIAVPTARDVRLVFWCLCRADDQLLYFGGQDVRRSVLYSATELRRESVSESDIIVPDLASKTLNAFYCQPDPPSSQPPIIQNLSQPGVIKRLASGLGLDAPAGLSLRAPDRRIVFGCNSSLEHFIGPDDASITFATKGQLSSQWIVAIRLALNRDWSWDGLARNGVVIQRDSIEVGRFSPGKSVSEDALKDPKRSFTDLIFFDVINPRPVSGGFPSEITTNYSAKFVFKSPSAEEIIYPLDVINLPIVTPPSQVPKLASAGIAMSEYMPSADYSATAPRQRVLWLEFTEPPTDPRDRFFARVLMNTPDPLLVGEAGVSAPEADEPPLPIDPEPIRRIVPGQSDDRAGVDAMQLLLASQDSPIHFLLPLPTGMSSTSPELFGLFTYEIRVGHYGEDEETGFNSTWCTTQGRFGTPLRVTGVQHPPPNLECTAIRFNNGLYVSAPYAQAVFNGIPIAPRITPLSSMYILLYVQAARIDGDGKRNILLQRQPAPFIRREGQRIGLGYGFGQAFFDSKEIQALLSALGFAPNAPLSVLAVEMMPQTTKVEDPLGLGLGQQRILRTSNLVPVPTSC